MQIGSVIAKFQSDLTDFKKGLGEAQNGVGGLKDGFSGLIGKAALVTTAVVGVAGAIGAVDWSFAKEAGKFEQYQVALETMLGSTEKANELFTQMKEFAKKTPFNFEEVISGAKSLLAYGFAQEDVQKNMKLLGNVAAGLSIPMGDMVYLYGTLSAQQIAYTKDMNQFANRGVPIWDEVSKVMGVSVQEVRKLVEQGQVGFPIIEQAFKNMTGEGGKFFDLMDKQAGTMLGKLSNLQDSWQQLKVTLGNLLLPVAIQVVDGLNNLIMTIQGVATENGNLTNAVNFVKDAWTNMMTIIGAMIEWFRATVLPPLQAIWAEFMYFVNQVIPPVSEAVRVFIFVILIPFLLYLVKVWKDNWDEIKLVLIGVWEIIKGVVQVAFAIVAGIFTTMLALMTGDWSKAWDNIKHYAGIAWEGIKNIFRGALDFIFGWGGMVLHNMVSPFENAWNKIKDIMNNIRNAIKEALDFDKRHSPSIMDILNESVGNVQKALGSIGIEPLAHKLDVSGSGGNRIQISMAGANISDPAIAEDYAELIGDRIIRKLAKTARTM